MFGSCDLGHDQKPYIETLSYINHKQDEKIKIGIDKYE